MHQLEQRVNEAGVVGLLAHQPELTTHTLPPIALETCRKLVERVFGHRDGLAVIVIEEGQEGVGKAREIPVRDAGLVAKRITAMMIDSTEHGRGVIGIHERTRAIVDRFAGNSHVIGIHDPVNETRLHPTRHEPGLRLTHRGKQRQVGGRTRLQCRVMSRDGVLRQDGDGLGIALSGEILKRADAKVACRHACEHGPW